MGPATKKKADEDLGMLFRQHLKEHHNIDTEQSFDAQEVKEHLEGEHTLIPITIFSNDGLSALETIVKYLKEEEGLRNSSIARILGRTPASVWITYRNAARKIVDRLPLAVTDIYIPTSVIASGKLSVLESVAQHLHEDLGLSYRKIADLLNRDERTIWTVCYRARKKLR